MFVFTYMWFFWFCCSSFSRSVSSLCPCVPVSLCPCVFICICTLHEPLHAGDEHPVDDPVLTLSAWTISSTFVRSFSFGTGIKTWNRLTPKQNSPAGSSEQLVALCWWFSWTCLDDVCYCRAGGRRRKRRRRRSSGVKSLHNCVLCLNLFCFNRDN